MGDALIPLSQGKVAIVDEEDLPLLAGYHWYAIQTGGAGRRRKRWYAVATKVVFMHRLIADTPPDLMEDHRDGDGLNNRRANLRHVTNAQNQHNSITRVTSLSPYKGVSRRAERDIWVARIWQNGHNQYLGGFRSPEDAARAYDAKARELFGEHARLNFP